MIKLIRDKSLTEILVRAKVAPFEKKRGSCKSCKDVCKNVSTKIFGSYSTHYCIKTNNLDYCSNNPVYLFSCKTCCNQYIASDLSFQLRFYNNISVHGSFFKADLSIKRYFKLILTMKYIMVRVIGKLHLIN